MTFHRRLLSIAAFTVACSGAPGPEPESPVSPAAPPELRAESTAEPVAVEAVREVPEPALVESEAEVMAPLASALAPCGIRTRSAPTLERYDELVPGARFHILLTYENNMHAWMPPSDLRMPMHHASSIEYIDYALPPPGPATIDLEVEGVERVQGRMDERTRTFFFTYRVRVIAACIAG